MRALAILVLLSLIVAACGGAGAPSSAIRSTPPPPSAAASAPVAPVATAGAPKPVFLTTQLTDVRTGEQFAIGGFPGKVVLVIAMAVW